jgi:hypothetical protein
MMNTRVCMHTMIIKSERAIPSPSRNPRWRWHHQLQIKWSHKHLCRIKRE